MDDSSIRQPASKPEDATSPATGGDGPPIPTLEWSQTVPGSEANRFPLANRPAIPGYTFLAELGRGGMGVVYRARDVRADRDVAIKVILSGGHASEHDLARFQTEARAVAAVAHPGIVTLFVAGESEGCPFLVMEFCPGGSLRDTFNRGVMDPNEAAALVAELADAVQAAHDRKVVHRDLKPANVLLTADGRPKITDFGLAKRLSADYDVTASNTILGTPSYMSPEQAAGMIREVSPATDIYSLGAILYEALAGVPPFRGPSATNILHRIMNDEPLPPSRLQPGVPRALDAICLTCLAKKPAARYASAADLATELRRFCFDGADDVKSPSGWFGRRLAWIGKHPVFTAGAVLVLAVGLVGLVWFRPLQALFDNQAKGVPAFAAGAKQVAIVDPNKIIDDKFGIRLTVPQEWTRVSPAGFNIGSDVYYAWSGPKASHLLLAVRTNETNDPRQMLDWMVEKKTAFGATVFTQEIGTVANMRAAQLAYKGKGGDFGVAQDGVGKNDLIDHWVIVPRQDGTTVVFMLTCPAEVYDEVKPSLESVLATLQLSGSQTKQQSESK